MNIGNSFAAAGFSRLAALAFALALPSLVSATTNSREESPQATSASVYADVIGSARFERSAIKVEQGYTVESGNLYTRDGETGSLVVVRSPDGTVTAIVDEPGKRGLLVVDAQGKSTFTPEPPYDYMTPDTVEMSETSPPAKDNSKAGETRYIDMLVAYTAYALGRLNTDPVAFALAQLESANLGLRNSRVESLSLRLAAVNVFDVTHDTSEAGLRAWQTMLAPYRTLYGTDVSAAYSVVGDAGGRAFAPGYTSVNNWAQPTAFRHEVGHNAGGMHCNDNPARYNFGYNNGQSRTYLCGNGAPYYSTPAVNDAHGLPLGNSQTADMARVWRENTTRLTSYKAELPGLRMMLVSHPGNTYGQAAAVLSIPGGESTNVAIVALSPEVGPIRLVANGLGNSSLLSVKLLNAEGNDVTVRLRASRLKERCKSPMNVYAACTGPFTTILRLEYTSIDIGNADLLPGYYNGLLELEAQSPDSDWKIPIKVAVSLRK
ncbi:hypothetical protein PSH84_15565 [Pseudomonas beijingensis]|jgi:hypothetical protein|uniref:hypothetical protein n=1 Tax=Pseudomonas beijingensis TaxID=2954101 RepID=UPI0027375354|nr:hypothetical protein [Pseudomonas sp. FP830]WLI43055.1 hypothetical protein PSH84_15565 [Pseudomonas sp. FP830]